MIGRKMKKHKKSLSLSYFCFLVLCLAQSSLNSQTPVLPLILCPYFQHILHRLIFSLRTKARLRAHYLTFLLRISFSQVLEVSHNITCACQAALDIDDCLWGLQEETGNKNWVSYPAARTFCFCVAKKLFENVRNTQMILQVILVQEHPWTCTYKHRISFASTCSYHKVQVKTSLVGSTCQWQLTLSKIH
jgi:hypothetical protein